MLKQEFKPVPETLMFNPTVKWVTTITKQLYNMANLTQMGVKEFKAAIGATMIEVLVSPTTGKLFASASNGKNYKVEQALDVTKAMVFIIPVNEATGEELDYDQACLINKRETEVKITL